VPYAAALDVADLYDPLTIPPELRKAHQANDRAVLAAYGFPPDLPEPEIVSRLFELYAKLVSRGEVENDDSRRGAEARRKSEGRKGDG